MGGGAAPARLVTSVALVTADGTTVLLDVTPDVRTQMMLLARHSARQGRSRRNVVDHICLTHAHIGHYAGLVQFGREAHNAEGVRCWATPAMASFLMHNEPWRSLFVGENLELSVLEPGEPGRLHDQISVELIPVPHRDELSDTVAISVNRHLLYLPDIDSWDQWPQAADVISRHRIALLDGCFYSQDELPERDLSDVPHPLVTDTIERFAHLTGRTRLLLTHLNHTNPIANPDSPEAEVVRLAGFEIASEGLEFEIEAVGDD